MPFTYSVVALPRSLAAGAPFHVSLFIAPRLSPNGKLGDFDPMSRWAEALSDPATKITLADQNGAYSITPALPLDPRYWRAVFPPETPVTAWASNSLNGRSLHSFPANSGPTLAKVIHNSAFGGSPIDLPSPQDDPIAGMMNDFAAQIGAIHETKDDGLVYDESRATAKFDDEMKGGQSSVTAGSPLGSSSGLLDALRDLHRARRFFERPESVQKYERQPTRKSGRLPVPERDFHERLTLLGDQPALLRRLGIIIDVRVKDLERLRKAQWLTSTIVLKTGNFTLPTRVRCRAVGNNLVTVGLDGGDWRDGALRIGDTKRYGVLDLDPDASALKLDRFLWTAPRLISLHKKGEPTNAAPPTLKGHGFGVARSDHAGELAKRQTAAATKTEPDLKAAKNPLMHTEDVARGLRVEVWDDTEKGWFSLHARVRTVKVEGLEEFTVEEQGWIQSGAVQETLAPAVPDPTPKVYVHEQLFGWSGWSLSAPHPALPIEHTYAGESDPTDPERNERVAAPVVPDKPQLHVVTTTRVAKGTLPWLRYGRSYALRAWVADLAGGSPDHALGKPPGPAPQPLLDAAQTQLVAPAAPVASSVDALVRSLRAATVAVPPKTTAKAPGPGAVALPDSIEAALAPGDGDVRRLLLARLDQRSRTLGATTAGPRLAIERAVAPLLSGRGPLVSDPAGWSVAALADVAGAAKLADSLASLLEIVLDTVTRPRPLLRWHPVDPPVLIPRAPYTEAESLRHLVVRSGVTTKRDPELGDTITVTDIASWTATALAAHPDVTVDYPSTCERHLAPPKISQFEGEIQGQFDAAMTPGADQTARRHAALVARREAGSFLDTTIPSIDDPVGVIVADGVQLVDPSDVTGPLPTLEALRRGDPLAPGQYVIHDTDEVVLPYLPDAMVRGVAMVFPDAGHDRPLRAPISIEGTTVDYQGLDSWPEVKPFRLVFSPGRPLAAAVEDRTITMSLPAAEMLRVRLSSSIVRQRLEQFGFWRNLPEEVRSDPALREAAIDGWLWALSPAEEMVFVHAVPKPLEAPQLLTLNPQRANADTGATLSGAIDVHGPSTERVDLEATWTQQEDDVVQATPDDRDPPVRHAVACTLPILAGEDIALLGSFEFDASLPGLGPLHIHRARHEFGDTRHRVVSYRARATTRFREYFHPALLAHVDDRSVLGPVRRVSVLSSARPAKPSVRQVLPMFRWEEETEPKQAFGLRRRRRAGVRIYLDRPWYSSGDGELLGVVTGELGDEVPRIDSFSQWGADPVWRGGGPQQRAIGLELDQLNAQFGRELPARPVRPPAVLPLVDVAPTPSVTVLGYRPEYDPARRLWFVDIAVDPGAAIWPFLRLVVARYQPESNPGLHLSPLVRCDYVQVPLERTATLTRPDDAAARVVLSGPVGYRGTAVITSLTETTTPAGVQSIRDQIGANRRVQARLQRHNATVPTDLGWETLAEVPLRIEGFDADTLNVAWVGSLALPELVAASRPGTKSRWRVAIEETEWLDADRTGLPDIASSQLPTLPLPKLPRVVYLDHLLL
jgi:hypothetical protein